MVGRCTDDAFVTTTKRPVTVDIWSGLDMWEHASGTVSEPYGTATWLSDHRITTKIYRCSNIATMTDESKFRRTQLKWKYYHSNLRRVCNQRIRNRGGQFKLGKTPQMCFCPHHPRTVFMEYPVNAARRTQTYEAPSEDIFGSLIYCKSLKSHGAGEETTRKPRNISILHWRPIIVPSQ